LAVFRSSASGAPVVSGVVSHPSQPLLLKLISRTLPVGRQPGKFDHNDLYRILVLGGKGFPCLGVKWSQVQILSPRPDRHRRLKSDSRCRFSGRESRLSWPPGPNWPATAQRLLGPRSSAGASALPSSR